MNLTPSSVARAVPIARLACSCLATVQGALLRHISSCPSWFALHSACNESQPPGSRVRACRAADTSKSLSLSAGEKGMTESHFLPSREDASMTDLALCGSKDSRSESLVARKASWHRSRCERTVWLAVSMSWSSRDARRCLKPRRRRQNARGAHVLKDRMPRPPSLMGGR